MDGFITLYPTDSSVNKFKSKHLTNHKCLNGVSSTDSDDEKLDKMIHDLENDSEESSYPNKPEVDKQIKKSLEELAQDKVDSLRSHDVGDKEIKDDDDEKSEDYWF